MKIRNKTISLADVAKLAGVSIATASRVMSESNYPVAAETRQKVLMAAKKLSYVTSGIGRALATQRTNTIGIIISDISQPFFSEVLCGVEELCRSAGFYVILLNHNYNIDRELQYFRFLRGFKPDGIVLGSCSSNRQHMHNISQEINHLNTMGIPVVCLQRHLLPIQTVQVDSVEMASIATSHLISLGHRNIAFLSGKTDWLTSEDRLVGYCNSMKANGISIDPRLITSGNWTARGGFEAIRQVLEKHIYFSAIVASNDSMAIGAMKALLQAGLRVPEDISVIGMNNIPNAELWHPALTTVALPLRELGAKAVELAIELMNEDVEPFDKILPCELIIRQSTAPFSK